MSWPQDLTPSWDICPDFAYPPLPHCCSFFFLYAHPLFNNHHDYWPQSSLLTPRPQAVTIHLGVPLQDHTNKFPLGTVSGWGLCKHTTRLDGRGTHNFFSCSMRAEKIGYLWLLASLKKEELDHTDGCVAVIEGQSWKEHGKERTYFFPIKRKW